MNLDAQQLSQQENHSSGAIVMNRTKIGGGTLLVALMGVFLLVGCGNGESAKVGAGEQRKAAGKDNDKGKERAEIEAKVKGAGELTGEGKEARGEKGRVKLSGNEVHNAGIKAEELKLREVSGQVVLTASVRANQDRLAHVGPRVPARITTVSVNAGDKVKAGQTLALLDSMELGEANSAYLQAKSQHAVALADFERAENLKADQIIPEKDYLRARGEFEKAKAQLRAAGDRLRLLGVAPMKSTSSAISVFPLVAPFAGTVIEKKAVLGELAQPDKTIFTVADLSTLWIEANLFEQDLARVRVGATATVTISAYPGESFRGKVTYISSTLDKDTRTVSVRIEVPNRDGRLKPEMFAIAAIDADALSKALLLPEAAILLVNGQPTVFVEEDGEYEPRPVEPGDKLGSQVVIKAGVKAGEQVVVAGAFAIKAKMLKSQIGDAE